MRGLRFGGVPLHPALVHFPVVAWAVLPALDLVRGFGAGAATEPVISAVAAWVAGLGLVSAVVAMTAGLIDLVALDDPQRKALGVRHMLWMASAFTAAASAGLLRTMPQAPLVVVSAIDVLAFGALVIGAHLGARLVHRD